MSSQSKASEAIRLLAYLDSGTERQEPDQLITNPGSILSTQLENEASVTNASPYATRLTHRADRTRSPPPPAIITHARLSQS
jgi:hypothetical protein